MDDLDIARVCFAAVTTLQQLDGETPAVWDDEQAALSVDGVRAARAAEDPEQIHTGWCRRKIAEGWTHGPVKDLVAKTHPCLVEFVELSPLQQAKDRVIHAVVRALDHVTTPVADRSAS